MIFCISVEDAVNTSLTQLQRLITTLPEPAQVTKFNRVQPANYPSNRFNVLFTGNIRVEKNGQALMILEAGDVIPHVREHSNFHLEKDGAIEVASYNFDVSTSHIANQMQRLLLEVIASQYDSGPQFQPDMKFFSAGEIIINQGDAGDTMLTLVEGQAQAEIDQQVVGEIKSGEAFGVVATLTTGKRSASVRAISNCMVMSVPAEQLPEMIKHNPSLSLNIMKSLASSLLQANEKAIQKD